MDAINFGTITAWGTGAGAVRGSWPISSTGCSPRAAAGKNPNDPTQTSTYVTAMLKNNGTTEFALKGGDATSGSLSTYYKGGLPGGMKPDEEARRDRPRQRRRLLQAERRRQPERRHVLRGCIVAGYPSDATDNAIQANIVAAGYGK